MIAGVLLAAGAGRRFGADKLGALLDGEPVVRHAARMVRAKVDALWVVVAPQDESVAMALAGIDIRIVVNARAHEGSGTSIAAGIAALPANAEAAVVALGDQPRLAAGVIDRLLRTHREGRCAIVAPTYRGVQANPVLFARSVFAELLALEGDEGARSVVLREPSRLELVAIDAPVPSDVDHPDDLQKLQTDNDTP